MINFKLLEYIVYLQSTIIYLITLLFGKWYSIIPDEPVKKDYRKLEVDNLPILERIEPLDFTELLANYFETFDKPLRPVKSRSGKVVPSDISCPRCGAPHNYIYDNNGGRGQYLCKVCDTVFKPNIKLKTLTYKCPHCNRTLELKKQRKDFNVYKCINSQCEYYLSKKHSMTKDEKLRYKQNPQSFKLHYIFREFNTDFIPLSSKSKAELKFDISRLRVSSHLLGLILTYSVNFGMGLRRTSKILKDVHGVDISHQTISNYLEAVSLAVKPMIDNYDYELTDSLCGDETYIKVNGKWHYIFFFMDSIKKTILSYRVFKNRDTISAIYAVNDVLEKLKTIPSDLKLITDGNPIYLLAQQFFAQHDINFGVEQVIGLTNKDEVSKEYRPLKQTIERLNRTFKGNYRPTFGYGSEGGSIASVTLFTAYYNFLRPHSSLEDECPVVVPELVNLPNMPARWTKLLQLSQNYYIQL